MRRRTQRRRRRRRCNWEAATCIKPISAAPGTSNPVSTAAWQHRIAHKNSETWPDVLVGLMRSLVGNGGGACWNNIKSFASSERFALFPLDQMKSFSPAAVRQMLEQKCHSCYFYASDAGTGRVCLSMQASVQKKALKLTAMFFCVFLGDPSTIRPLSWFFLFLFSFGKVFFLFVEGCFLGVKIACCVDHWTGRFCVEVASQASRKPGNRWEVFA